MEFYFGHVKFKMLLDIQVKSQGGSWRYKSDVDRKVQAADTKVRVNSIEMELEGTIMNDLTKGESIIMPYCLPCI